MKMFLSVRCSHYKAMMQYYSGMSGGRKAAISNFAHRNHSYRAIRKYLSAKLALSVWDAGGTEKLEDTGVVALVLSGKEPKSISYNRTRS